MMRIARSHVLLAAISAAALAATDAWPQPTPSAPAPAQSAPAVAPPSPASTPDQEKLRVLQSRRYPGTVR